MWISLLSTVASAANPELLFSAGNKLYAKADYKGAISNYQQLIQEGHESATVYFNLGNAYYKANEIPSALLYLEKAYKLAPTDDDISYNLQMANLKTADKLDPTEVFFITRWWRSFLLLLTVQTLSVLSVLFFSAGFGILIVYVYTQSSTTKRFSFYAGLGVIVIGVLLFFMAGAQERYLNTPQEAIVFSDVVSIKSEPSPNAKSLFVLHEGVKVVLKSSENDGWIKVTIPNGSVGFVKFSDLKLI